MLNETINNVKSPTALTRPLLRDVFYQNESRIQSESQIEILGSLELQKLDKMIEVFEHPGLQELIVLGEITFGAIKPRTQISKLGVEDDDEGERKLLSMVKPPLKIIFSTSLAPTEQELNEFYPIELRDRLSLLKDGNSDVWSNFVGQMLSGPVTYFILYDPHGNAVEEWRTQIGVTNPEKADPNSIRGKYAIETKLNLVHGSSGDTSEEKASNVKTEINWLKSRLSEMRNRLSENRYFPSENILREVGVIAPNEELVLGSTNSPFKRVGGEKFMALYSIIVQKPDGTTETRNIAEKAIVSLGFIDEKIATEFKRLEFLKAQGANVPKTYGHAKGSLYQEFIPGEKANGQGIIDIKSKSTPIEERNRLLDQLVLTASILDNNGFQLLGNFIGEMLYDGHNFYFIDGGIDLGEPHPEQPNQRSLEELLKTFRNVPNIIAYITQAYKKINATPTA